MGTTIILSIITSLISAIVGSVVATVVAFIKQKAREPAERKEEEERQRQQFQDQVNLMLGAQLCLMRKELIHECEKYKQRGKITVYGKDNIRKMYLIYHQLGGNGTVTDIYNEAMNLQLIEED